MILAIESSYSLNSSIIKDSDLKKIKSYGYSALGLVDYSTSFFYTFYKSLIKDNIKPIVGLRINGLYFDYILYPINNEGYVELIEYASTINSKEVNDKENIIKSNNIIYTLDTSSTLIENVSFVKETYFYFKSFNLKTNVGVDFSNSISKENYLLVSSIGPTIITKRIKYLDEQGAISSEILSSILNKTKYDFYNDNSYIDESMLDVDTFNVIYKDEEHLINRTNAFINAINLKIDDKGSLISFDNGTNMDNKTYLEKLSNYGLKIRLNNNVTNEYKDRLKYELDTIHNMGFDDYFLIVYDYVFYAKNNGILIAPGRGSAASSLVAYTLGIVDIDPVKNGLLFQRFLNPARHEMPDIDTDIESERRKDLINYVIDKYGKDHVGIPSVYEYYRINGLLKEVGSALSVDNKKIEALSILFKEDLSFDEFMNNPKIKNYYEMDEDYKKILDISHSLEGVFKSSKPHTSAIIISNLPLNKVSEIHVMDNSYPLLTYDANVCEKMGLLKMDFLSSPMWSFAHNVIDDIKKSRGIDLDIMNVPLDDSNTYKFLREKPLSKIFHLNTPQLSRLTKRVRPIKITDIAACLALDRPGTKEKIDVYINRKENKEQTEYYDPCLEPILKETYGVILYQEQVMKIGSIYSGFTLEEEDYLRKAIASKDPQIFNDIKTKFFEGALKLNRNVVTTERLFNDMYKFSGYGLNKAHSISYASVAYYIAYLKANFTPEFLCNMLKESINLDTLKECNTFNVSFYTPNPLYSNSDYVIKDNSIYMPYSSLIGIGMEYSNYITEIFNYNEIRFEEFVLKAKEKLNKGMIETLIYASVFDYTNYTKKMMIESLDGLFIFGGNLFESYKINPTNEFDFSFLKEKEKKVLGFNYKYHPIKKYKGALPKISDLNSNMRGISIVGLITNTKEFTTKSGDKMMILQIEDEFKSIKGKLFTSDYTKVMHFIKDDIICKIYGNYEKEEETFIIKSLEIINV